MFGNGDSWGKLWPGRTKFIRSCAGENFYRVGRSNRAQRVVHKGVVLTRRNIDLHIPDVDSLGVLRAKHTDHSVVTIAADLEGRISAIVLDHRPTQQEELNITAKQHRSDVRHGSQERSDRDDCNDDRRRAALVQSVAIPHLG